MEEPKDEPYEGAFSFVLPGEDEGGVRKLPSLYMGPTLFYADRSDERVKAHFGLMTSFIQRSVSDAVYSLHPVRIDGVYGLYGRDFFNRSLARRRLQRRGMEFAEQPFVLFDGETFEATGWGTFESRFVIFGDPYPDSDQAYAPTSAEAGFSLLTFRVGKPELPEVRNMLSVGARIQALANGDEKQLVESVRSGVGGA